MYAHELAGRFDNIHGDEVGFGFIDQIVHPSYCDYLISLVSILQDEMDSESAIAHTGKIEFDLLSTKKSVVLTDVNGKQYKVTVEEV